MKYPKKAYWLQTKKNIVKVFNPDHESGICLFHHEGTFPGGKKYGGMIGIVPFFLAGKARELLWSARKYRWNKEDVLNCPKCGHTFRRDERTTARTYDLIRVKNETVAKLGRALLQIIGEDVKIPDKSTPAIKKRDEEMKEAVKEVRVKVEYDELDKEVDKYLPT